MGTTERSEARTALDKAWAEVYKARTKAERDRTWAAWDDAFVKWANATSPQV